MAHRRTFSSRGIDMAKVSLDSPPLTPSLAVLNSFHHSRKPKQYWQRTTFLALFALVVISGYVLLVSQPSFSPIAAHSSNDRSITALAAQRLSRLSSEAYRLAAYKKKPKGSSAYSSSIAESATASSSVVTSSLQLTPEQELAALTSFLASLPQNILPSTVDPSQPLDPQLVLDFDTARPQAVQEVEQLVHDAWARYPVVLYSKMHSPVSRELKKILTDLNLKPDAIVIEVEHRPDEDVLRPVLKRLTKADDIPILLIGGKAVTGTIEEIRYLYTKGDLGRTMGKAGAIVDGKKKPKGRKH